MKKLSLLVCILFSLGSMAQNSYESSNIAQNDLIGAARYVGMGGALNALGAEISAVGSNAASSGLYRKNSISTTGSLLVTANPSKVKLSYDLLGVVFSYPIDNSGNGIQFFNIAVNYKKNTNYFYTNNIDVKHLDNSLSQTYQIADISNNAYNNNYFGMLADISTPVEKGYPKHIGIVIDDKEANAYYGVPAKSANYQVNSSGREYATDINASINISNQCYIGGTISIHSLKYRRHSNYGECGIDGFNYKFNNIYNVEGSAIDCNIGIIYRPIIAPALRVGFSVNTPTRYTLKEYNEAVLYSASDNLTPTSLITEGKSDLYEYKYKKPWVFNFSAGYIIGKKCAVGIEYEYKDCTNGKYYTNTADKQYLSEISKTFSRDLKEQHTIKIGAEYVVNKSLMVRAGYNLVSSAFKGTGYKTILYFEPSTETDFTNWKSLHRLTAGIGYRYEDCFLDFAYQYNTISGDFYAFDNVYLKPTIAHRNRHIFTATIGVNF